MRVLIACLAILGAVGSGPLAAQGTSALPRDVFVLVDVSGSMVGASFGIGHSKVVQAKNLVRDLLTDQFDWARHPDWQFSLLSEEILAITSRSPNRVPLVQNGSRVFLKRFGDPSSSKMASVERLITDPARDVDALFGGFPSAGDFDDQRTFLWLARAMTRREAMARGLTAYLLVEITDAREDKESIVDPDDDIAVKEFKSLKHVALNGEIGSFAHKQTRGEYVLQVNIRLVRLAGDAGISGPGGGAMLSNLQLPQGLQAGDDGEVSWDSFNASGGLNYSVVLARPDGTSSTDQVQAPPVMLPGLAAGLHTVEISVPGGNSLKGQFEVDPVVAVAPTPDPSTSTGEEETEPSEILLQSPRRDAEITSGSVTVAWRVVNPTPGCKYLVTVTGPPGSPKIPKKTIDGTRASFSIRKAGPYRVRIAATARGVKPASGTFVVKNEAGKKLFYALLTLLPIVIVAVIAIRHARRRRRGEDEFDSYSDHLD